MRRDLRHERRGSTRRGTTMSTMSSAPSAFASQNAFSRASMSCAPRRRRQHVHVDRAELGQRARPSACDVGVEPVARARSPARPRGRRARVSLHVLGHAELEVEAAASSPTSSAGRCTRAISGPMPRVDDRAAPRRSPRRGCANGASTVAAVGSRGCSLSVTSVTSASVPSDPMIELGEVVAGRRLHELAAGADDLAVGQHDLEPQHVVARDAVLHRAHAAGVGVDVAAEAGASTRRGTPGRRDRAARVAASSWSSVTPGWTMAMWLSRSISRIASMRSNATSTPPCRGIAAPDSPCPSRGPSPARVLVAQAEDLRPPRRWWRAGRRPWACPTRRSGPRRDGRRH